MITKDDMKAIRMIEDKYGLVLFRMAFTHLFDVGVRNFDNAYVEECIHQINEQGKADEANGKKPVMTPAYQCEIIRCAGELAQFSIWTLFYYIKKHVHISL